MTQGKTTSLNTLKQEINYARQRLETLWKIRGCTDPDVLKASMELDLLLNEYHRLSHKDRPC
ncbi:MAG: aspartyl-phosphate phosphatase Spo0E family protein [Firmicutes bacterium]|nr:aspartyl-phosphate phosphatase Spo0E family protein [Bacillota bacterium]